MAKSARPTATKPPGARTSAKRRTPVPQTIADRVMIACDRICCVCRRDEAQQIHHLNEKPDDHRPANLAALCFGCHEETQLSGGFGRRLTASEIRRCRDAWCRSVRERRRSALPRPDLSDSAEFARLLDAVAVVRIREIGLLAHRGGEVELLHSFVVGFGPRVALEAFNVLSGLAHSARRSHRAGAEAICDIAEQFAHEYLMRRYRPFTTEEREVLRAAQEVGHDVAYYAARRGKSLGILNAGARLLWWILRCAVLKSDAALRSEVETQFRRLLEACQRSHFADGHRWLVFLAADATQIEEFTGLYPADIEEKLDRERAARDP